MAPSSIGGSVRTASGGCRSNCFGTTRLARKAGSFSSTRYASSGWVTTTKTYNYDLLGNRTDNGGAYTGNRITGFNNCTYTTDFDGNVTARAGASCAAGAASFVWNAEGQLDSVQVGTTTGVKYFYDAAGRLVFKRVNNTPAAFQLWDGGNPLADLNGLATSKATEYSYFPGLDSPCVQRSIVNTSIGPS